MASVNFLKALEYGKVVLVQDMAAMRVLGLGADCPVLQLYPFTTEVGSHHARTAL